MREIYLDMANISDDGRVLIRVEKTVATKPKSNKEVFARLLRVKCGC